MVAALNDLPVLQHHDRIGVADCRKPVGDDKGRPVRHQTVNAVLDVLLRPRIDRTRRLIQNQQLLKDIREADTAEEAFDLIAPALAE